jgi:tellurite resistance protein TerC
MGSEYFAGYVTEKALSVYNIFVFLGAALINSFAWVFYLVGLVLLLTAGHMLKPEGEESHTADNIMVRLARKAFHTADHYDGDRLFTTIDGKRAMTPM